MITTSTLAGISPYIFLRGAQELSKTGWGCEILFALVCSALFGFSVFLALLMLSSQKGPDLETKFATFGIVVAVADLILGCIDSGFIGILELAAVVFVSYNLLGGNLGKAFGVLGISIGITLFGAMLAGAILL